MMRTHRLFASLYPAAASLAIGLSPLAWAQPDVAVDEVEDAADAGGGGPVFLQLTAGQTVDGRIDNTDYSPGQGYHMDIYVIQLEAGVNYRFRVAGTGFNADVSVFSAEGNPVEDCLYESDAGLFIIQVAETASYSVVVGASENAGGAYQLVSDTVVEAPTQRPGQAGDSEQEMAEDAVEGGTAIAPPADAQRFEGELNAEDIVSDTGKFFSFLSMELSQGQTYHFMIESPDMGVFLNMQDNDGNNVTLDAVEDAGGYIRMTAPADGNYSLLIVAREAGTSGSYTITAWQGGTEPGPGPGPAPEPEPNAPVAMFTETLDANDIALDDGRFFAFHPVELEAGTTYRIDLASEHFNTVAYLFDAENNQLDTNDDGPDMGTHSSIVFTPPLAGTYSIGVSSVDGGASGAYAVSVTPQGVAPGPGPAADGPAVLMEVETSATGDQGFASLDMTLQAGQRIAIETYGLSEGCDTIVQLRRSTDPDQASDDDPIIGENDDDAGLLSSRLVVEIPETGDYYVMVTVYENSGGEFTLVIREAWPHQEPLAVEIELEAGQSQLLGDFEFGTQQNYIVIETLEMSEGFDSVLELRKTVDPERAAEDDPLIATNDNFFTNALESRMYFKPDEPGLYYVRLRNIGEQAGTCTFRIRFED